MQSAGVKKEPKRAKNQKGGKRLPPTVQSKYAVNKPTAAAVQTAAVSTAAAEEKTDATEPPVEKEPLEEDPGNDHEEDEEEDESGQLGDDLAILSELTGQPVAEDELLYTIPVCAPYSALANYKYKVKVMPGTGKKGKACKTAVSLFLAMKPQVAREADLIRAIRDTDMSKNLPGKVKVSAPNMSKVKK